MLAVDVTGAAWQNQDNPLDVDTDGYVAPLDALLVIQSLHHGGSRPLATLARAASVDGASGEPEDAVPGYVDVNGDNSISSADALSVISALNGEGEPGDVVTFRLEITNSAGAPVNSLTVGDNFLLKIYVQDTRADPGQDPGVFAAYLDVAFNSTLSSVNGQIDFSDNYANGQTGSTATPGLIDELGAFDGFTPLGTDELLLVTVPMRADAAGTLSITSNRADVLPQSNVLIFGSSTAVDPNDVLYGSATVTISGTQTGDDDLVQFAKNLTAAGTQVWMRDRCSRCTDQLALFEDGAEYLDIRTVVDDAGAFTPEATAAGVTAVNTWIFPDGSRYNGAVLSLADIASRSGVAIPKGVNPSLFPIGTKTVLGGSPLAVPLDGYDPNGGPLTYTVTSSNPSLVTPLLQTGNRSWRVTVQDFGDMVFEFYEDKAFRATDHFVELSDADFFNNVTFHRVFPEFVIQGGDPTGTGGGGSTLGDFDDQFNVDLQHNQTGILSMAKSTDDTNDSQFFVTEGPTRSLDFNHTIFGMLIEGARVREGISSVVTSGPANSPKPVQPVVIEATEIFTDVENGLVLLKAPEGASGSANVTVTVTDQNGNRTSQTFAVNVTPDTENGNPFLADIVDPEAFPNETVTFQADAIDVEGDPVFYTIRKTGTVTDFQATISPTGLVTVVPPTDFVGTLGVIVSVSASTDLSVPTDDQLVLVQYLPNAPTGIDLLADTDTGASDSDNVTSLTELQFQVTGVVSGATVRILRGETVIGEATATGNTVTVANANLSALGDGQHVLTAVQVVDAAVSDPSPALTVTLDQTVPVALSNVPGTEATVGEPFAFNAQHPEEGIAGFRYSLANAPIGMTIDGTTGLLAWTPAESQRGTQSFTIVTTDLAGNARNNNFTVEVASGRLVRVRLETFDLDGNPITSVAVGGTFELRALVEDLRDTPTGVSEAFVDVSYDSGLAATTGSITFGADFPNGRAGTLSAGLINEVGGSTTTAIGGGEHQLFAVRLQATAAGLLTLAADPADNAGNDVILNGETVALTDAEVDFGEASISLLVVGSSLIANDDTFTTDEDTPNVTLDVMTNDLLSPTSLGARITAVSTPNKQGTVQINARENALIYNPAENFFGTETFTYTITDSSGATDTAAVTVTLNPVNDPPNAVDLEFSVAEDTTTPTSFTLLTEETIGVDAGSTDPIELSIRLVDVGDSVGTVTITSDVFFQIQYTPAPNFFGPDSFTYTVRDGDGLEDTGLVTINVTEVNDAPTAVNDVGSTTKGFPKVFSASELLANDSAGPSESAQTLTITAVTRGTNTQGTVSLSAGGNSITYTPPSGFVGTDTFAYTITDNGTTNGAPAPLTASGTVSVTVTEGNAPPTAFDDNVFVARNSTGNIFNVLSNDSDPENGLLTIQSASAGSRGGTTQVVQNGSRVQYTPPTNVSGTETFTYVVRDAAGNSDSATVTVTIGEEGATNNSSFAGQVYFDTNNNGTKEPREQWIVGVPIVLDGTDQAGHAVSRQTTTDINGNYQFNQIPLGSYTVKQQQQPDLLLDGSETAAAPATSPANDQFALQITADGVVSSGNTFGERGLDPRLTVLLTLASRGGNGFLAATKAGQSEWIQLRAGWSTLSSLNVAVSDDLSDVTITGVNSSGQTVTATAPTSDKSRVVLLGQSNGTVLVQIKGASTQFNFTPAAAAAAVDAAFADDR